MEIGMNTRNKAPTFTSDTQGYLHNPLSDSGISWWHVTSPYTLDIEEEGFRIPSYFASDIDSICRIVMSVRRPDPVTLYDVKLRISPENLLSPQAIFKDWVRCWLETYEDGYGQEWDDEANDPNPWFGSPEFVNELTPLGKSLYREVGAMARGSRYSAAAIMSMLCGCKYQAFDILKNASQGLFEEWCWRNNICAWVESELNEGWTETSSGTWAPVDGFNIGVWDTSRVEIVEVFPDILECEHIVDIEGVVGRRNPQNLPIYVNNLGIHTNAPIPLYHATTAADAIIKEGFKTPDELPRGSFGLGSSGMGLISMTGDHRYAEAICVHMAAHARIGIGDLRWSDLMADFRRVSPKRYQAIVDGTDLKARNLIHVLKVMGKGQVPVNRGMFGEDMSLSFDPERHELVSMEEYVEYQREHCVSNNFEHMIDDWTNPAKSVLAGLYNDLLWINDGTIENPVGDSNLWMRFLGRDLSVLDQIAYVRADLESGMRIVSRNHSADMPSVFYRGSGDFSVDEYGVQKLKRGEDLHTRKPWGGYRAPTPLPESETGLTFDVDSEFVDRVPAQDYSKFAVYLHGEDEFRLPAPRDQLTPAVLEATAMDILELLPRLWQGKDVTCFYPRIGDKLLSLKDNLYS
jgi:hypothetical protein